MKTRADEYEEMLQQTWPEFFMSPEAKQRHNEKYKNGYPIPMSEQTEAQKEARDDGRSSYLDSIGYRL